MFIGLIAYVLAAVGGSPEGAVASLGPESDYRAVENVARFGCAAVPLLVRQLEVVTPAVIGHGEKASYPREMRVVWSIASLRYITDRDFYADQSAPGDPDSARQQMLVDGAPPGQTKFFGIWMSRGTVYFASPDEQRDIIRQWQAYSTSGQCGGSRMNRQLSFWLYGARD